MNNKLNNILLRLADAAYNLSEDDLEKVISGTHSFDLKITKNKVLAKTDFDSEASSDTSIIAKQLEGLSDRNIAENYLRDSAKNKKELEVIARYLDIAVSKQDKAEDLVAKIVESTVGARLRSAAIRGE